MRNLTVERCRAEHSERTLDSGSESVRFKGVGRSDWLEGVIYIPAVPYLHNRDGKFLVSDSVNNTVITLTYPISIVPRQLSCANRPWIICKLANTSNYSLPFFFLRYCFNFFNRRTLE